MLNEFWATASTTYKVLVFSAMGLIAVGIILNVVGNSSSNQGLAVASLPVIGLGLILHIAGDRCPGPDHPEEAQALAAAFRTHVAAGVLHGSRAG